MFNKESKTIKSITIAVWLVTSLFSFAQNNASPVVTASGDQRYCIGSYINIVEQFEISSVSTEEINEFNAQISLGYQRGFDVLILNNPPATIRTSWNAVEGKLTLSSTTQSPIPLADLISAVESIQFYTDAFNSTDEKVFSLTLGSANYLPSTQHYYQYVSDLGITWQQAKVAAEERTYFGLRGYLATLTSADEAIFCGEQTEGTGWIGGSDEAVEGTWRWMGGPEEGLVFWQGDSNGSSPNYAFWNTGEPNNLNNEDYAHITSPNIGVVGAWNDLPAQGSFGDYEPKGYIVEYGGMPNDPTLFLSATTKLRIAKITQSNDAVICGPGTLSLNATSNFGTVVWFENEEDTIPIGTGSNFETPYLLQSQTFYAKVEINGCISGPSQPVKAIVKRVPQVNSGITLTNCDEDGTVDGFTTFNLNEYLGLIKSDFANYEITFHLNEADAQAAVNSLEVSTFQSAVATTLYFRLQGSGEYCHTIGELYLETSTTQFPLNYSYELSVCDADEQDGIYDFYLEDATAALLAEFPENQNLGVSYYKNLDDALLLQQAIDPALPYKNNFPENDEVFVRVDDKESGTCFGIAPVLQLRVIALPKFSIAELYTFCSGETTEVQPENTDEDYMFFWYDGNENLVSTEETLTVNSGGTFKVTATNSEGCVATSKSFTVVESFPPQLKREFVQVDDDGEWGSITVLNDAGQLGNSNYLFSLDEPNGDYTPNTIFTNIAPGLHTLYAKDVYGCGIDEIEIGIVGMPNFFTPNGDTINDALNVLGLTNDVYKTAELWVMDRYGRALGSFNALDPTFKDFFKNTTLPAGEYWYRLHLVYSNGGTRVKTGHFTLKR